MRGCVVHDVNGSVRRNHGLQEQQPADLFRIVAISNSRQSGAAGAVSSKICERSHGIRSIAECEKAKGLGSYWYIDRLATAAHASHADVQMTAAIKAEVLRVSPGLTIAGLRDKEPGHPEALRLAERTYYSGLRRAGIPEN